MPLLKQMLGKLTFFCQNRVNGCEEQVPYDSYVKHHEQCQFQRIPCPSPDCQEIVIRQRLRQHLAEDCAFVKQHCVWCKGEFCKKDTSQHEKVCELRQEACYKCKKMITSKLMQAHLDTCEENEQPCKWCKKNFKLKCIVEHQEQCDWRIVRCFGCDFKSFLVEF